MVSKIEISETIGLQREIETETLEEWSRDTSFEGNGNLKIGYKMQGEINISNYLYFYMFNTM